uniref:AMP-binding domain-containing protein n=1 Tax=Heterorhabditis bacteriophora TaxID=37862 RepID=A0A1I7WRJ6_HETBA
MSRRGSVKVFYHGMAPHIVVERKILRKLIYGSHGFPYLWILGYGMTESTMATHMPDLKSGQPFGSIVDPSTGKDQKVGERGEICVRGPTVMLGYLGRPDATSSTIIDGWLHTGKNSFDILCDIGYVDNDGNLFIVDRLKELIKVKGLQLVIAKQRMYCFPLVQIISFPNTNTILFARII